MRFVSLFSKYMVVIYRCISIVAAFLIVADTVFGLFSGFNSFDNFRIYINLFVLLFITFSIIFPVKIEFLAIVTFIYAVEILVSTPFNQSIMGFMMYILTCAIFFSRGYFRKKRFTKITCAVILYFLLFATQLRFGREDFVKALFMLAEYSFLLFLIIFFYYIYLRNQGKSPLEKFLDLSLYPELSDRDKEWIELILKETKYSTIAKQYNITEGTVKNRMRFIFKTLDVSDRIGFMATFGGFQLKK